MPSFVSMISQEDQETISQLCRSVLVEHGTGWMEEDGGTAKITVCVKKLWTEAFRVGYKCGLEKAKNVCCQEDHVPRAAVTEEMEAERVWGYNVGWKLCSELQKASTTASLASLAPPRSLSAAAVQTEPAVVPNAPVVPDAPLDWAEDAAVLPISSPRPYMPSTPPSPRDYSALSSGSAKPFASLQRRRRRSPRAPLSWTPSHSIHQRTKYHYPQKNTHSYSMFFSPVHSTSIHQVPTRLDWDRDPRLRDLSRALTALGWVKV
ncbi:hypothetical protein B0H13DRAFT_2683963 [Mycena leptocephala]|nr:hypothetical protein B0H13DRAFT_2683963 [Mycena leptocephala]